MTHPDISCIRDMLAQNAQIIAVIELVGHALRRPVAIRIIAKSGLDGKRRRADDDADSSGET